MQAGRYSDGQLGNFCLFPPTLLGPLRRTVMQLAGYFCPTTEEEVAVESQDPAPIGKKERRKKRKKKAFLSFTLCLGVVEALFYIMT